MRAADVFDVLDRLDEAGVRHWVGGGWGVAAPVGRLTRAHRDLDLAIQADDFDRCLDVLAALGYLPETDWLPVRIEMGAPDDRWVDLNPVKFGQDGYGRQEASAARTSTTRPEPSPRGRSTGALSPACPRRSSASSAPGMSSAPRICTTWPNWLPSRSGRGRGPRCGQLGLGSGRSRLQERGGQGGGPGEHGPVAGGQADVADR